MKNNPVLIVIIALAALSSMFFYPLEMSAQDGYPCTGTITVRIKEGRLNMRGGPGASYPVVGKLGNGETFSVSRWSWDMSNNASETKWFNVSVYDSLVGRTISGWVNGDYCAANIFESTFSGSESNKVNSSDEVSILAMQRSSVMQTTKEDNVPSGNEKLKALREKAEKGDSDSMLELGSAYLNGYPGYGLDDKPYYQEAMKWFHAALDKGNTTAFWYIGVMYEIGEGVPQDYDEANKWYKAGADKGDRGCEEALAQLSQKILKSQNAINNSGVKGRSKEDDRRFIGLCAEAPFEFIEEAIKNGANVNAKEASIGWTALMFAAYSNTDPDVITLLIEHGADVNQVSPDGTTPLMAAAMNNSNPLVTMALVLSGANVNAKDNKSGFTALMWAVWSKNNQNNLGLITTLIQYGADVNVINNGGTTVLDFASNEVRTLLIKHGARSGSNP